jgi:hypothetical protein
MRENLNPVDCLIKTQRISMHTTMADSALFLASLLKDHPGLVNFTINSNAITDEEWVTLFGSVCQHPMLKTLKLQISFDEILLPLSEDAKKRRTRAVLEAVKECDTLEEIQVVPEKALLDEMLLPEIMTRLDLNRYRPRVQALAATDPALRLKLLAKALGAVGNKPDIFYLMLSKHVDVAFPSTSQGPPAP